MGLGVTFANAVLDALVNGVNLTADTSIFMSLHTATPGTTGASEVTDGTYARVDVSSSFSPAASAAVTNDVAIEFPAATTGFTTTHGGFWSAASAGTFYHGFDINPDKVVGAGEILRFAVGEVDITIT